MTGARGSRRRRPIYRLDVGGAFPVYGARKLPRSPASGSSWHTSLENGDARNVSATTVGAVAQALRLDESERQHLMALVGLPRAAERPAAPETLVIPTSRCDRVPGVSPYLDVAGHGLQRRLSVALARPRRRPVQRRRAASFSTRARPLHGDRFEKNIEPVIAMLQASIGQYPNATPLRELRDRVITDPLLHRIWSAHEIASPLLPSVCTIMSPVGLCTYETLTLLISNVVALVVQVPDESSTTNKNDAFVVK